MTTRCDTVTLETAYLHKIAHEMRGSLAVIQGALTELEIHLSEGAARHQRLFAMARRGVARGTAAASLLDPEGPVSPAGAPSEYEQSPKGRRAPGSASFAVDPASSVRILVVEDDDDSAALLVCLFERQGWGVDTVASLSDARRALGMADYGVLVTDLHLPDGSGVDLLAMSRPRALRTAFLVTGALDEPLRSQSEALGFAGCLCKPLSGTDIVDAIRTALQTVEAPR